MDAKLKFNELANEYENELKEGRNGDEQLDAIDTLIDFVLCQNQKPDSANPYIEDLIHNDEAFDILREQLKVISKDMSPDGILKQRELAGRLYAIVLGSKALLQKIKDENLHL